MNALLYWKVMLSVAMLAYPCAGLCASQEEIAMVRARPMPIDAASQIELGLGFERAENYQEAARCYRRAADLGKAQGQYFLAELYEEGKGVTQSYVNAAKLYESAAAQGHIASKY